MLLTVSLPVYNAMPYLPAAVESILGQSYRDFEFLIIDDGSSDGSADYLRSLRDPSLDQSDLFRGKLALGRHAVCVAALQALD